MRPAMRKSSLILVAVSYALTCTSACSERRDDRSGWVNYHGSVLVLGNVYGGIYVLAQWRDVVRIPTEVIVPPLGECRQRTAGGALWNTFELGGSALDAGATLTLLTPIGPVEVASLAPLGYFVYGAQTTTAGSFVPRMRYELIGSGGSGVPPFVGDFNAPSDLAMISPLDGDSMSIPRSADLPILWRSTGGLDTVVISVSGDNDADNWGCSFPDTGMAMLSSNFLARFPPGYYTLSVEKIAFGAFTASEAGLTAVIFEIGHGASLTLE